MAIQLILLKQNPNGVVRENGAIYMFIYYNIVDMFNYADTLCLVGSSNVCPCFNEQKKTFKQGLASVFIALQMLYFWKQYVYLHRYIIVREDSNVRLYSSRLEKRFRQHDKIFDMIHNVCYIRYVELYFALRPVKIVMQVLCFSFQDRFYLCTCTCCIVYCGL